MTASIGVCVLLLASVPVFARTTGSSVTILPDAIGLLPGLFAQAGIAEEVLFRGYLFGRLRRGRSFWRAAFLSTLPFVGVHLLLFGTMPWPVALAALMVSVATSFPLARLFELGGFTIWAPAILHFVIQATVKVLAVDGSDAAPCSRSCGWRRARSFRCSPSRFPPADFCQARLVLTNSRRSLTDLPGREAT